MVGMGNKGVENVSIELGYEENAMGMQVENFGAVSALAG
jgi:hypothetical protein